MKWVLAVGIGCGRPGSASVREGMDEDFRRNIARTPLLTALI
jgi:hypothetical protein